MAADKPVTVEIKMPLEARIHMAVVQLAVRAGVAVDAAAEARKIADMFVVLVDGKPVPRSTP